MYGNTDTHDYLCRKIANIYKMKVVSVDYRMSPESRFPNALKDVYSVYSYFAEQSDNEIILSGDGVGGNLCAALCIKIKELKKLKSPIAQVLAYTIFSNNFNSPSFKIFDKGYGLTNDWVKYFIYQYTGADYDDPYFNNNKFYIPF